jgi:hypothetical protein
MQRLLAAALGLGFAVACGGSGSSASPGPDETTGGEGTGTSSGGDNGSGTPTPGDFSAFWRQKSAKVQLTDPNVPAAPQMGTVQLPSKVTYAEYDQDLEIFEQLKDDQLVIYANAGGSAYYRVTRPALKGKDTYSLLDGGNLTFFEIKAGVLQETQIRTFGSKAAVTTITFEKYADDFPPADWPADVIETDLTEALK